MSAARRPRHWRTSHHHDLELWKGLELGTWRVVLERQLTDSVDAENPSGALRLYTSMGFIVDKQNAIYRNPLSRP